ncbi:unnamed protein product [Sphagnum jensenii]|uniref:Uncharacterized protein n=1 Tax=Sphagnum jensenii TaxID=128206 RepID=A0ABP0VDW5_9BRYO
MNIATLLTDSEKLLLTFGLALSLIRRSTCTLSKRCSVSKSLDFEIADTLLTFHPQHVISLQLSLEFEVFKSLQGLDVSTESILTCMRNTSNGELVQLSNSLKKKVLKASLSSDTYDNRSYLINTLYILRSVCSKHESDTPILRQFRLTVLQALHSAVIAVCAQPQLLCPLVERVHVYERMGALCESIAVILKDLVVHLTNDSMQQETATERVADREHTLTRLRELVAEGVHCSSAVPLVHAVYGGLVDIFCQSV